MVSLLAGYMGYYFNRSNLSVAQDAIIEDTGLSPSDMSIVLRSVYGRGGGRGAGRDRAWAGQERAWARKGVGRAWAGQGRAWAGQGVGRTGRGQGTAG